MASSYGALFWIFMEAGATKDQARHLEKNLDTLRINGWGSDDVAELLLRWRNKTLSEQAMLHRAQVEALNKMRRWKCGLPDAESLFKSEERTGG